MRKNLLTLSLILLMIGSFSAANAQKNVVKLNLWSLGVSTGSLFYERAISENMSFVLGASYTSVTAKSIDTKFSGISITPEFRFYLSSSKEAPAGFYVAPFVRYRSFKLAVTNAGGTGASAEAKFTGVGGGLLLGKQWILGERVSIDLFGGPQYTVGSTKVTSGSESDISFKGGLKGFGFRSGLTLGFAF